MDCEGNYFPAGFCSIAKVDVFLATVWGIRKYGSTFYIGIGLYPMRTSLKVILPFSSVCTKLLTLDSSTFVDLEIPDLPQVVYVLLSGTYVWAKNMIDTFGFLDEALLHGLSPSKM